ncbi:helix-turn-helix domain-containing protein [Streptomyces sp. NPDC046881]|uniref:TetR/AcrR family transcriptional regulator n=1 Tax=Streptomyces sp. NPDC046881 TaxID=3155374 RepID=UPI0033CCA65E
MSRVEEASQDAAEQGPYEETGGDASLTLHENIVRMTGAASAKRDQILTAALGVFGRYGFRRTSMDLLAQAAGMSRPALYQHFKSKADVFKAVGARLVADVGAAAEQAAARAGTVQERLYAVLAVKLELVGGSVEVDARRELIVEAGAYADDVQADLRRRLIGIVAGLLDEARPGAGVSSFDTAVVLVDALSGIAQEPEKPDVLQARLRHLVLLVTRGFSL